VFVLPCLVEGALELADCAGPVRCGADLIGVSRLVWQYPGGPAEAMTDLLAAIAAG
jgi:hypothetical protein